MPQRDALRDKFIMLVDHLETAYLECNNDQQRRDLMLSVEKAIENTVPIPLEDLHFPKMVATKGGRRKNLKGKRDKSSHEHADKKRLDEEKKQKQEEKDVRARVE